MSTVCTVALLAPLQRLLPVQSCCPSSRFSFAFSSLFFTSEMSTGGPLMFLRIYGGPFVGAWVDLPYLIGAPRLQSNLCVGWWHFYGAFVCYSCLPFSCISHIRANTKPCTPCKPNQCPWRNLPPLHFFIPMDLPSQPLVLLLLQNWAHL